MSEGLLHLAIEKLGGPTKAAAILGRKQPTISGYLKDNNPPLDVCLKIEAATEGEYRAEQLRPDLADAFGALRTMAKPAPKAKRARAA